ncbi:hypothetical protein FHW96_005217 [Novosphingobium sp. SG751A]|uniref:hypothetical protein n=1 Tax=Novosphingobium sp. SG751A TaxID=2587000 RepID=UPI001551BFCB|nr:hypothetical protein [Novosphingobium sp. SG751A]NOW49026.1 hypothetical protein [Novosphingobium sp. SG751A]
MMKAELGHATRQIAFGFFNQLLNRSLSDKAGGNPAPLPLPKPVVPLRRARQRSCWAQCHYPGEPVLLAQSQLAATAHDFECVGKWLPLRPNIEAPAQSAGLPS